MVAGQQGVAPVPWVVTSAVPFTVWHHGTAERVAAVRDPVRQRSSLTACGSGVYGPGLYASLVRGATINHGPVSVALRVPVGTPMVVADPVVTGVGIRELLEAKLPRLIGVQALPAPTTRKRAEVDPVTCAEIWMQHTGASMLIYPFGAGLAVLCTKADHLALDDEPIEPPADLWDAMDQALGRHFAASGTGSFQHRP